jgi:hypothetical protein
MAKHKFNKEYEFFRNGTVHGTVNAKTIGEARSLVFAAFGEKLVIHRK